VAAGRTLGPDDYSVFAALNSFSLILGAFTSVVHTLVTDQTARLRGRGEQATGVGLLLPLLRVLLVGSVVGAALIVLLSRPIAAFLKLPAVLPVVMLALSVIPVSLLPAISGTQAGLQRFGALGVTRIGQAVLRLITMVGFLALGWGATGAVAVLPASSVGAVLLGIVTIRDIAWRGQASSTLRGLISRSVSVGLALVCFNVLISGDVIIVKSRFSPYEAGLYSALATLGRTTLWLSTSVVTLFLPRASALHAQGGAGGKLLKRCALYVGMLAGGAALVCFAFPTRIVSLFFGPEYVPAAWLLGWYSLAMALLSIVNVWVVHFISVQEHRYTYVLLVGVAALIGGLAWGAPNSAGAVFVLIGVGMCLSLAGIPMYLASSRRGAH